jgi:hypothetical protein
LRGWDYFLFLKTIFKMNPLICNVNLSSKC